ncbi:MAG: GDYXXLXY domain-containing protein [Fusobacterium sp.]|uniref:GDYXXLXY domain-containing protein n=1 Tax=Fusobacterium sp. TaxID=68766 RepID=UPI0026DB0DA7|nr:GDYXXLXY domain-containing protein [Fusobacterium sp.]MDO4690887.1 GDYXXLXY domain-containing protein [Fusobacterium sp.]
MNKKIKQILIALNFVFVFLLTFLSVFKEESYKKREGFYLELAPVDPRSLMQGDYMILNYSIVNDAWDKIRVLQEEENKAIKRGYIAVSLDKNNVAIFKDVVKKPTDDKNLLFIEFKSNSYDIKINADSFFFQEGDAHLYENARYSKVVLIKNTLRLINLVDELPVKK